MLVGIKCKSGSFFAACNSDFLDAEWKLQECYYIAQGCLVEESEEVRFSKCDCDHCESLNHEFDEMIEEIKSQD